jgi:hypothetical protein
MNSSSSSSTLYAYHGHNRSIHSSGQFEAYKNKVDDRSMKVGGKQCIRTNDGYVIPLDIINGLPYLKMQPPNDAEMNALPHVIFTGGDEWNPTILDHSLTDKEDWYNVIKDIEDGLLQTRSTNTAITAIVLYLRPLPFYPQSPIPILMDYPLVLNTHLESPHSH